MDIALTPLADVVVLKPKRFRDNRGFFSETYSKRLLADAGLRRRFCPGQCLGVEVAGDAARSPVPERAVRPGQAGKRDARRCPARRARRRQAQLTHFGRHFSILLSAEEGNQIFVPIGFGHGFLTLEPDTMNRATRCPTHSLAEGRFRNSLRRHSPRYRLGL